MTYTPYYPAGWDDAPATTTPISSAALEHMEAGILAASSSAYGFYRVVSGGEAGSTSLVVDGVPGIILGNVGHQIIIDPFTTEAEIRAISEVLGNTLTLERPLTYSHDAGDQIYFLALVAQGGLIPWTWFGGQTRDTSADVATNNTTAYNRLMYEIANNPGQCPGGIYVDRGTFYVNGELNMVETLAMRGTSPISSTIRAHSSFPFTDTGEVAIIHPVRVGVPVSYASAGVSGRWFMSNFYVHGGDYTNGNGILTSPQQPDHTENLRVDHCAGLYGICLTDVQQHVMTNIELIGNAYGLRLMNSCHFIWVRGINFEQSGVNDLLHMGGYNNTFDGVHIETSANTGLANMEFYACSQLDMKNIWISNDPDGAGIRFEGCGAFDSHVGMYEISNYTCYGPFSDFKMIDDVDRGWSIDAWSARRHLTKVIASGNQLPSATGAPAGDNLKGHSPIIVLGTDANTELRLGGSVTQIRATANGGGSTSALFEDHTNGNVLKITGTAPILCNNAAPADGDLAASELALWFDDTNSASALGLKAKQADGTVKTASISLASAFVTTTQSGTTYTLALVDSNTIIEFTNGSAVTVTIPANASVAFPIDTVIELCQYGAGQVSVTTAGGVTLNSPGGKQKIAAQYGACSLRKRGTNEWMLEGDIAA